MIDPLLAAVVRLVWRTIAMLVWAGVLARIGCFVLHALSGCQCGRGWAR